MFWSDFIPGHIWVAPLHPLVWNILNHLNLDALRNRLSTLALSKRSDSCWAISWVAVAAVHGKVFQDESLQELLPLRARMSDMANRRKIPRNHMIFWSPAPSMNKVFACCVISTRNSFVEALTTMPEIWQNSGMTLPRGQSIWKETDCVPNFLSLFLGFSIFCMRFSVLQERTCAACSFARPGCRSHKRKGLQRRENWQRKF